ncbi:MAG: hypothetical protein KA143_11370 [Saprospiraceae bacterium]|nr:hypothetical protein [Saprospiraceae bacterium]
MIMVKYNTNSKWRRIILSFITCLWTLFIFGQNSKTKKVLFVGNSYTYFWNLPLTVQVFAEKDSVVFETRQSTGGGMSLRQHWNQENNLKTMDIIQSAEWDCIILQDHSMQAIQKPDSLHYFGKLFSELIHKKGAKTFLYSTWSREKEPQKQELISSEYEKLAMETGATVIPVGRVWEKVRRLRPDIQLFDKDGSHPSPAGTYLTACVVYTVLSGKSPIDLPARVVTHDRNNEKLYLNIQPEMDVKFFQEVVQDMIRKK